MGEAVNLEKITKYHDSNFIIIIATKNAYCYYVFNTLVKPYAS